MNMCTSKIAPKKIFLSLLLLCTNIPTAGTADKISPNFSPGQHHNIDVVPFVLAKGLGFSYVEKYYEVRPIW